MPADFIEDLNAHIAGFEAAIANQSSATDDHINASVAIDDTIDQCAEIVRKLDGLIRNKYADSAAILAEWTAASHTERAPRRAAAPAPATTPVAPSTPAA